MWKPPRADAAQVIPGFLAAIFAVFQGNVFLNKLAGGGGEDRP